MKDRLGRNINYLRISVTDRCNLRCRYCMPVSGVRQLAAHQILSFEEISAVARVAVTRGVTKLRLTGGEPLVRRDIQKLVALLAEIPGVTDLALTTNGTLLSKLAKPLARAGLQRVNVSLDTVRSDLFRHITRGGDVNLVFKGIQAALAAGLKPIKINCVIEQSPQEIPAREVANFCKMQGLELRFIRLMDFQTGTFSRVDGGSGGDCPRCNRIRLSADGMLRPCLFSDLSYSIRNLGIEEALRQALFHKPEAGGPCQHNWMRAVGG